MIVIVPYKDHWPSEFAAIAPRLRAADDNAILAIHHIGSTSVPGLAAKDIIDVQVTVADLALADRLLQRDAGFTSSPHLSDHCPPGMTLPPEQLEKRLIRFAGRPA